MPRTLIPCPACAELVFEGACTCPHCGERHPCASSKLTRAAVLMGLGLTLAGCTGDKADDSSEDTTEDTQSEYTGATTGE